MKKLILAIAILGSTSAMAYDNGYAYNQLGNDWSNDTAMDSYGKADVETEFTFSFKGRSKMKGDVDGASKNSFYTNGNSNWDTSGYPTYYYSH